MKHLERKLRWLENQLEKIEKPVVAKNDKFGQGRTLLQNSKTKEAMNLYEKIAEAELLLINSALSEDEFVEYQRRINDLEDQRQEIVSPKILAFSEINV